MVLSKTCGWRLAVSVITLATITLITFSSRVLQMKINFTPKEMDIQKNVNSDAHRFLSKNSNAEKIHKTYRIAKEMDIQKTYRIAWYNIRWYPYLNPSKYDPSMCSIKNCFVEENMTAADIVLINHLDVSSTPTIKKGKNQIWEFHTWESPYFLHRPSKEWSKLIDLSASYMEFSDFFVPFYGRVKIRTTGNSKNLTGILKTKRKDAVWVSSHCSTPAKRENLVKELAKYINVDSYGACGNKKCGKQYDDLNECAETFVQDYKFYFAFENSICDNYTTEKLYSLFRDRSNIIPVVHGPRDVSKYLPKGTYINSFDFASPKELAMELKRIGNNESLYIRILQEKDKYILPVDHREKTINKFQCDMCKYLHDLNTGKTNSKAENWRRVYNESLLCV